MTMMVMIMRPVVVLVWRWWNDRMTSVAIGRAESRPANIEGEGLARAVFILIIRRANCLDIADSGDFDFCCVIMVIIDRASKDDSNGGHIVIGEILEV